MKRQNKRWRNYISAVLLASVFAVGLLFAQSKAVFAQTTSTSDSVSTLKTPGKTKIKVTTSKSKVYITWKQVEHATAYRIYRKKAGGEYHLIKISKKLRYCDKDVKVGAIYTYKVVTVNSNESKTVKGKKSNEEQICVSAIDPNKKMVALTFDDGPGIYTESIVKCLRKYGMHGTFFMVGSNVKKYPEAVKAVYESGCEVANHTYSHVNLSKASISKMKSEVSKTNSAIKKIIGESPKLLRPPYGATSSTVKSAIDMPQILWSIDTLDWKTRNTAKTVSAVMNNVKDGAIVLMHDIHKPTRDAALQIIPKLVKKGYQLVTVSELAEYKDVSLKGGKTYSAIYD